MGQITNIFRTLIPSIILFLLAAPLPAQTAFFNNGAIITISTGAQIGVIGNMVSQDSNLDIVTSASLRVEGDLTVSSNTLRALGSAELVVSSNLIILLPASVIRMTSGTIFVSQNLVNTGTLDNRGVVRIGCP